MGAWCQIGPCEPSPQRSCGVQVRSFAPEIATIPVLTITPWTPPLSAKTRLLRMSLGSHSNSRQSPAMFLAYLRETIPGDETIPGGNATSGDFGKDRQEMLLHTHAFRGHSRLCQSPHKQSTQGSRCGRLLARKMWSEFSAIPAIEEDV